MATKLETLVRSATVPLTDAAGALLGTAFFVAPGIAITAAHVLFDAVDDTVFAPDRQGVLRALQIGPRHPKHVAPGTEPDRYPLPDLAVLVARDGEFEDTPCVQLGGVGDTADLLAVGYNGRPVDPRTTIGENVALFTFEGTFQEQGVDLIKVKLGAVDPGMSGAPVLDREAGRVVGIVKATRGAGKPHGAYVVAATMLQQLEHTVWARHEIHHKNNPAWRAAVAGDFVGPDPVAATREILDAVIHEAEFQRDTLPDGVDVEALHQTIWMRRRSSGRRRATEEDVPVRHRWRGDRTMPSLTVVSGDPGFGKSWLLRYHALTAARQAKEQLAAAESVDDCTIPLRLTCMTLASDNGYGAGPLGLAKTLVAATLSPAQADDSDGRGYVPTVERALLDGRVLLCLDGLDEMPTGLAARLKQSLITLLSLNNTLLVTSRPVSLGIIDDIAVGNREDFQLVGFSSRETVNFVRAWLGDRPDDADGLLAAFGDRPELAQLAEVPLLLSFLCRLADPGKHENYRRSTLPQLYGDVVRHLLSGRWHGGRSAAGPEAMPDAVLRMRMLAEVLGRLQDRWRGGVEDIAKAELGAEIRRHPDYPAVAATAAVRMRTQVETARNPIADVAEPVLWELLYDGLLLDAADVSLRPTVRFIHPILRETLLAAYFAGLTLDEQVKCIDRHRWMDTSWTRVFVAAASLAADPAALVAHILSEDGDPWVTQRTLAAQVVAEASHYRDEASAEAVRDAILAATQSPLVFERRRALDALGILLRSPVRPLRVWAGEQAAALDEPVEKRAEADAQTDIAYVAMSSLLDAGDETAVRRALTLVAAENCPARLRLRLISGLVALNTAQAAEAVRDVLEREVSVKEELTAFLTALRPHSHPAVAVAIKLLGNRQFRTERRVQIGRALLECGQAAVEAVRDTADDRTMTVGLRCQLYADLVRAAVPDVVERSLRLLATEQPKYDDRAELALALIEDGVPDSFSHAALALANRNVSWTVREALARALARHGDAGRDLLVGQLNHGGVELEVKIRHLCALVEVHDERGLTHALSLHADSGVPTWIRVRLADALLRHDPSLADEDSCIELSTMESVDQRERLEIIVEMARHGRPSAAMALMSVLRERSGGVTSWPDMSKRLAEAGRVGRRCLETVAQDPDLAWNVRCDAVLALLKTSGAAPALGPLDTTIAQMPPMWHNRLVLALARNGLAPDLGEFVAIARDQRAGYRIIFEFLQRAAVELRVVEDLVATARQLEGQDEPTTDSRIAINTDLLTELGIEYGSDAEGRQIVAWIYKTLETRVGARLAGLMLAEQLEELEVYFDAEDNAGAQGFLEHEIPEYPLVVRETFAKMKEQLRSGALRPPRLHAIQGGAVHMMNISHVAAVLAEWIAAADARQWGRWQNLTLRNATLIASPIGQQLLVLGAKLDQGWGRYQAAQFAANRLAADEAGMLFEHSELIDWLKGQLEEGVYEQLLYGGTYATIRFGEHEDAWLYAAVGAEQLGDHQLALGLARNAGQTRPPTERQDGSNTLEDFQLSLEWSDDVATEMVAAYIQGVETTPLSVYQQAVEFEPDSSVNHFNLGIALQRAGRPADAVEAYRRAAELEPDARRHRALAIALFEVGRHDEALAALDFALTVDRHDHLAYSSRGYILLQLGRHQEALTEYREARRLAPTNRDYPVTISMLLRALGRTDDAVEVLLEAIKVRPRLTHLRHSLAYAQMEAGRPQDALSSITEALAIDPLEGTTHDVHGSVLSALGRYADSAVALAEAVRLDPAMSASRANYAEALILCGRLADAEPQLREAIRLGPANDVESFVLLAVTVYGQAPDEAAELARQGLAAAAQPNITPFRHSELRSIAHLLLGDAEAAVAEIREAAAQIRAGDHRREPLYVVLRDLVPPEQVDALVAAWPAPGGARPGDDAGPAGRFE
ncbi:tetratricopeptide repeat protein [Dactylosporangium sp. CS-047395]|uniref:tetratricopeptide repeat protein n=1 Tax=Dactylosporangium sp. CS-047395 TaxID=3239936 RepID=UPI003D8F708D